MTIQKLREVLHAEPFEPFSIHISDGRSIPVPHPDFVSVDPKGRIAHVFRQDGTSEFVDFRLVTTIRFSNGKLSGGGS